MASRTEVRQILHDHDTRTVTPIGNSAGMTLPASWAADHGIEPGDEVIVRTEDDGSLVVEPPAE